MTNNNLIYCLKCPFTGKIHYIGKSTSGLRRPMQHLTKSHSSKIREWVDDIKILGYAPIIGILEENFDVDFINDKELFWIDFYNKEGCILLNTNSINVKDIYQPKQINSEEINSVKDKFAQDIAVALKNIRKINKLTQPEFAEKMGIGLRWLRKVESGDSNIILSNLIELLDKFNLSLKLEKK